MASESSQNAQQLVLALLQTSGMSPQEIAEALDHRVSWRTIYRWAKGEHCPQQDSNLRALEALVQSRSVVLSA